MLVGGPGHHIFVVGQIYHCSCMTEHGLKLYLSVKTTNKRLSVDDGEYISSIQGKDSIGIFISSSPANQHDLASGWSFLLCFSTKDIKQSFFFSVSSAAWLQYQIWIIWCRFSAKNICFSKLCFSTSYKASFSITNRFTTESSCELYSTKLAFAPLSIFSRSDDHTGVRFFFFLCSLTKPLSLSSSSLLLLSWSLNSSPSSLSTVNPYHCHSFHVCPATGLAQFIILEAAAFNFYPWRFLKIIGLD